MNEREQERLENQKAIDEYFALGGKVTTLEAGLRSDPELLASPWNRRKAAPKNETS
jgi:hypothetical protein|tara:strand:- start:496 stop:663 length:168 start_codon:yes stop_codon:yes gene_type:complete